jgi:hypothetical protein
MFLFLRSEAFSRAKKRALGNVSEPLWDSRPDLDSGVTRSSDGQFTGLLDPPPVSGQLPFRHSSKRIEIDMRP